MFLFSHMGLTYAAARGAEKALVWRGPGRFAGLLDYRLVFLGSILPDFIDKPLGGIILRETLGNGRIYSHTLLFLLALLVAGLFPWKRHGKPGLLVVAAGVFFHHVLDGMWRIPQTLLWPAYGWPFPKGEPETWLWKWLANLSSNPWAYLPEIIGLVIFLSFIMELLYRKQLSGFIRTGRINQRQSGV